MSEPNPSESDRRRAIARRIVDHLAARTDLRASLLTGSAAQGNSDEHSDIDLLNYYAVVPALETFNAAMDEVGVDAMRPIRSSGRDGFSASYWVDGIEVQTGAQLIAGVDERLLRLAEGDADMVTIKIATGLLEGIPLHGDELVRTWQRRAAFPESLRVRQVEAGVGFFPIWAIDDHLAARDAELFRRQMLLDGAYRVLAILSAVNRLYFTDFQFKRARAHIERMKIRPERLAERLDEVADGAPSEAARELGRLVAETKAIVRSEMPDIETDVPWRPPVPEASGRNPT